MQDKHTPIGILPFLLFGWSPPLEAMDTQPEDPESPDKAEPMAPGSVPRNRRPSAVSG